MHRIHLHRSRRLFWFAMALLLMASAVVIVNRASAKDNNEDKDKDDGVGIFQGHGDVGAVLHAGAVEYDSAAKTYMVSGSGENMWLGKDEFQFVWKKVSGDVTIAADISILTEGNEHRKAVLMIRQSLDPDSPYADLALHGNGLTSLQYRDAKGDDTHEVESNISAPQRLSLTRQGEYFYMELAKGGGEPQFAGGSVRVPLSGEFYVGIGVCSHDKDKVEKAKFSNVTIEPKAASGGEPTLYSMLETVPIDSTDRRDHVSGEGTLRGSQLDARRLDFSVQPPGTHHAAAGRRRHARGDGYWIRRSTATMITESRPTEPNSRSAIRLKILSTRRCMSCP